MYGIIEICTKLPVDEWPFKKAQAHGTAPYGSLVRLILNGGRTPIYLQHGRKAAGYSRNRQQPCEESSSVSENWV